MLMDTHNMKFVIPFVFAVGCLAFSPRASIPSRTISPLVKGTSSYNYTSEDCSVVLVVVGQDESIYLGMLSDDFADYQSLLVSRTQAAFQISQVAGNCALAVQRSTIASLTKTVNGAREDLISAHRAARKFLTQAKTEQEIAEAIEYAGNEKQQSATYFEQVVRNLETSAAQGIMGIQKCTSPGQMN